VVLFEFNYSVLITNRLGAMDSQFSWPDLARFLVFLGAELGPEELRPRSRHSTRASV
jgi:hypothetical protein